MSWDATKAFLSKVVAWPGENPGYVNLHYSFPNERGGKDIVTGKPFRDIGQLISYANWARTADKSNIKEIWYCTSVQSMSGKTGRGTPKAVRLHSNATMLKAIWIDIDVGNKPETPDKNYESIEEAWSAFVGFRNAAKLPPPSAVVKSGGGIHIYWISDKPLLPAQWAPYAQGLKSLLIERGVKCDAGLTTDNVRLLRLPNTLNFKYDPPRPVELLPLPLTEYDFAEELSFLAELAPAGPVGHQSTVALPDAFKGRTPIFVGATDNLSDGIETRVEMPPLAAAPIVKGCAFIRTALETGGKDYSQPMWNLSTLAATFLEDGHALAHKMGRGHSGYDSASTDELWARKLKERADRGIGWPSCQAIQASGCGSCGTCPHFAAGKSPLNLRPSVDKGRPTAAPAQQGGLPEGFILDHEGFICKVEEKTTKGGETLEVVHRLLNCKIDEFWAQKGSGRDVLNFRATHDKGNFVMANLSMADMVGGKIGHALALVQVKINPTAKRFLEEFFVALLTKLHKEMEAQESRPFGWLIDGDKVTGFAYGGLVYHGDGAETKSGIADINLARCYRPTGETQPWIDACKMLTDLGRPELDAMIAVSFAAPLLLRTGEEGVTVSAYGPSGTGKSSAMKVGMAVWGNPVQSKEGAKSTEKALAHKMGELRHLPVYWDDVTTKAAQVRAVSVTFDQTGAIEGSRLTQTVDQRHRGQWCTILGISSNISLVELVIKEQQSHLGGINRVFEYEVGPNDPTKLISTTDAGRMLVALNNNYGHIGAQYAKFLGTNSKTVDRDVKEMCNQVERDLKTTQEERFWKSAIATLLVGAKYANQFGAEFGLAELKSFLYSSLQANRQRSATEGGDNNMEDLLTQYLQARAHTQTIWTDGLRSAPGRPAPVVLLHGPPPSLNVQHGIQVRYDVPTRRLLISRRDMKDWLDHREVSWGPMEKWIRRAYGVEIRRVVLASGTTYRTAQQEHTIFITVPAGSPMEDVMMQYKERSEHTAPEGPASVIPINRPRT